MPDYNVLLGLICAAIIAYVFVWTIREFTAEPDEPTEDTTKGRK